MKKKKKIEEEINFNAVAIRQIIILKYKIKLGIAVNYDL